MRTKQVLILWADDESANLGVRVLAKGAARLIKAASPNESIAVFYHDLGHGACVNLGLRAIVRNILHLGKPYKAYFQQFDVVIDTGAGDSFTDIYGLKRLVTMAYCQVVIHNLRKPLILAPQTIGPFQTRVGRQIARFVLRRANIVLARDPESAAYSKKLGRPVDAQSTDVAFMLEPASPGHQRRDVLLSVSGLLWRGSNHVISDDYRLQVRTVIRGLLERGREVSLLVHVLGNDSLDEDGRVAADLSFEMDGKVDVLIPKDLDDARNIISASSIVIGARMHACLNALSLGVPCVAWAYSRKFSPLLEDVGWQHVLDLRASDRIAEKTLALADKWATSPPQDELSNVQSTAASRLFPAVQILAKELRTNGGK